MDSLYLKNSITDSLFRFFSQYFQQQHRQRNSCCSGWLFQTMLPASLKI